MDRKNEVRILYKHKRHELSDKKKSDLSARVVKNALLFLADRPYIQHIHVFLPIERLKEINTFPLINELLGQHKEIYTSISDHDKKEMKTVKLSVNQDFAPDKHGIPVPAHWQKADETLIQLIFMPLLAYDLAGHRVGYGKGFYDRFLSNLSGKPIKAGLSYFHPEDHVPVEQHDVPLDVCINPETILKF